MALETVEELRAEVALLRQRLAEPDPALARAEYEERSMRAEVERLRKELAALRETRAEVERLAGLREAAADRAGRAAERELLALAERDAAIARAEKAEREAEARTVERDAARIGCERLERERDKALAEVAALTVERDEMRAALHTGDACIRRLVAAREHDSVGGQRMNPIGQTWCARCGVALHRDESGTYVPAGEHRRDCPDWQPVSGSPESDRRKLRNARKRRRRAIRAAGGKA